MGGQLAEEGVNKSDTELVQSAKDELGELIPWLDLNGAQWGVLNINRAEINLAGKKGAGSTRPDSFSIEQNKNVITAWPTKMALSPALADALVEMVDENHIERNTDLSLPEWGVPGYAGFPWDETACWLSAPEVSE
jgi:hypothetical protein